MAEQSSPQDVLQAMDILWFNQNILKKMPISNSEALPPPSAAVSEESSTESDMASTANSTHQFKSEVDTDMKKERERLLTPTLDIIGRSKSELQPPTSMSPIFNSLPQSRKHPRRRLEKMRSSMSFSELEHEELKGFRDLGFIFNKEQLSPQIKSMLPGLQMLGEKQVVTRPYLSEAWLINRPDSPLLNLRVPPNSASSEADMRKHLRLWARTVACIVNQES
eukprot:TRINITY_DN41854_c1_g1_i1.p1 TRINITY_DN41854_c1_g1~~TRINITY_DN41854_c1_g1_i1.p1  ORF type:complete len:222 (+),score=58.38 TRINITY_DN41854_c1_g1_i1:221-886(+)